MAQSSVKSFSLLNELWIPEKDETSGEPMFASFEELCEYRGEPLVDAESDGIAFGPARLPGDPEAMYLAEEEACLRKGYASPFHTDSSFPETEMLRSVFYV